MFQVNIINRRNVHTYLLLLLPLLLLDTRLLKTTFALVVLLKYSKKKETNIIITLIYNVCDYNDKLLQYMLHILCLDIEIADSFIKEEKKKKTHVRVLSFSP